MTAMTDDLIVVCSWCLAAGTVVAPPQAVRSDGICDRHAAVVLLHSVKRVLRSPEYLSQETRARLAASLDDVQNLVEKETR